jgi:hypothetical protein
MNKLIFFKFNLKKIKKNYYFKKNLLVYLSFFRCLDKTLSENNKMNN